MLVCPWCCMLLHLIQVDSSVRGCYSLACTMDWLHDVMYSALCIFMKESIGLMHGRQTWKQCVMLLWSHSSLSLSPWVSSLQRHCECLQFQLMVICAFRLFPHVFSLELVLFCLIAAVFCVHNVYVCFKWGDSYLTALAVIFVSCSWSQVFCCSECSGVGLVCFV